MNNSFTRFSSYLWGVFITAYARQRLFAALLSFEKYGSGRDAIYSDTDSVKFANYERYKNLFVNLSDRQKQRCEKFAKLQNIPVERFCPKDKNGERKWLGVWDDETPPGGTTFKTLGAKRYLTKSGEKMKMTVSGVSKKTGIKWLVNTYGEEGAFEHFKNELVIPPEGTGKLTHLYIDVPTVAEITDYLGNTTTCAEQSSVHLSPCEYSLGIMDQYLEFVKYVQAKNTARVIAKEYPDK